MVVFCTLQVTEAERGRQLHQRLRPMSQTEQAPFYRNVATLLATSTTAHAPAQENIRCAFAP
jgi:hypothetical protein